MRMRRSPDNVDAGSSSTVVVGAPTSSGGAVVGDASSSSPPHAASSGGVIAVATTPCRKVRRVMMNGRPLGLIASPPLSALRYRKVAVARRRRLSERGASETNATAPADGGNRRLLLPLRRAGSPHHHLTCRPCATAHLTLARRELLEHGRRRVIDGESRALTPA